MAGGLDELVVAVLTGAPEGLRVRDLVREVRARAPGVPRSRIEALLRDSGRFVAADVLGRVTWSLSDSGHTEEPGPAAAPPSPLSDPSASLRELGLRDWQVDAFAAWAAAGCRGVVEAVTGTGKTRLGVAAVQVAVGRGGRALVLVPTLDLQDQWARTLRRRVPGARIGRLGGGSADDLHDHHVVVATPQSAAAVPLDVSATPALLVADEAHRYGAPTWSEALAPGFDMRLALTATYERNDDGLVEVLGPYFGGVVARYGYTEAARDGVIAPFRVAMVGVALDPSEREAYAQADAAVRRLRSRLLDHGLPRHPLEQIAAAAAIVGRAEGRPTGAVDTEVRDARAFLSALRGRRDVAARCAGKLDVVRALSPALAGHRSLVFTDTVEQAEDATRLLAAAGVAAEEIHGGLADRRRRIRMAQFRKGALECVVAPRVLDEGVDVPAADVALVLAAFRTRRQMIQRLGRVLRVKDDGGVATLVVAFAAGTREDPDEGAHEEFLDEILPVAREVVRFDAEPDGGALQAWLG